MDAVTTVTPLIDGAPMAEGVKALYATGTIIAIDAKDLKMFAIRAGVVAAYGGLVYWGWRAQIKPAIQEHKERQALKKREEWRKRSQEARAAAKSAEQATS